MSLLIFDTETTGTNTTYDLLTAHFIVADNKFNVVDTLSLNVKPDNGIYTVDAGAMDVNKINLIEHNKVSVPYKEAKSLLYNFLQLNMFKAEKLLTPVGQNVKFDIDFVTNKIISQGSWESSVSYRTLDTGTIANYLQHVGKIPADWGLGLNELVERLDIHVEGEPHTAKRDTEVTFEVLKKLIELGK